MPFQEDFAVEQFMDKYETNILYNLGETCCYSLCLNELEQLTGERFELDRDLRFTYGAIKGSDELRSLVASLYSDKEVKLDKDNVLITNGAIGANFLVSYTLAGPGDHVICVDPTYQQLSSVPKMFGAEVELLGLNRENDFIPDIGKLKSMIKKNTKCIVLNNPNNPLGSVIPTATLEEIAALARKDEIRVICDEVYRPLFHSHDSESQYPKSMCVLDPRGVVTGSMSKAFACAGLRLGWIVSQDKTFLRDAASRRDYNTISVSMVDDTISRYVLKHRGAVLKRNMSLCKENLEFLCNYLDGTNGKLSLVNKPAGGSVCLVQLDGIKDTEAFCSRLAEKYQVLCVPGETFGVAGCIRIGYGNSIQELKKGLPILEQAYNECFSN